MRHPLTFHPEAVLTLPELAAEASLIWRSPTLHAPAIATPDSAGAGVSRWLSFTVLAVVCSTHAGLLSLVESLPRPIPPAPSAPVFAVLIPATVTPPAAPASPLTVIAPAPLPQPAALTSYPSLPKEGGEAGEKKIPPSPLFQRGVAKPGGFWYPPPSPTPIKSLPSEKLAVAKPKPASRPVPTRVQTQRVMPKTPMIIPRPATATATPRVAATVPSSVAQPLATSLPVTAPVSAGETPLKLPEYRVAYLRNPAPAYPADSRRNREEGRILLRVLVNRDGRPETVQLQQSSGYPGLDQAALDAVQRWRFVPAQRGDTPVSAWVAVPVVFRLRS